MDRDTVVVKVEVWVTRKDAKAITEAFLAAQFDSGVEVQQAQYSQKDENEKADNRYIFA